MIPWGRISWRKAAWHCLRCALWGGMLLMAVLNAVGAAVGVHEGWYPLVCLNGAAALLLGRMCAEGLP